VNQGREHGDGQTDRGNVVNRRQTLKLMAGAATLASAARSGAAAQAAPGPFKLPPLGYPYEALEPYIDTMTMRIHHDNHHAAYVNNLNGLAAKWPGLGQKPMEEILANLSVVPGELRTPVRNNLGGHWNHTFFWELMTPGGAKAPTEEVGAAIGAAFGGVDRMKSAVKSGGLAQFGSGWAWLAVGKDKKLTVFTTANQDTPHIYAAAKPILAVDLWEHAYYLKYQSRRGDYIDAWWNTVNWDKVAENLKKATA
jgi:superoxide dismutase, Fe-Mn family